MTSLFSASIAMLLHTIIEISTVFNPTSSSNNNHANKQWRIHYHHWSIHSFLLFYYEFDTYYYGLIIYFVCERNQKPTSANSWQYYVVLWFIITGTKWGHQQSQLAFPIVCYIKKRHSFDLLPGLITFYISYLLLLILAVRWI